MVYRVTKPATVKGGLLRENDVVVDRAGNGALYRVEHVGLGDADTVNVLLKRVGDPGNRLDVPFGREADVDVAADYVWDFSEPYYGVAR